jgi:hypothetical protein
MMTPDPDEDTAATPNRAEDRVEALLRFDERQATFRRLGPCAHLLRRVWRDGDGAVTTVVMRCRNRRAAVCPSCSALYRLDARHLLAAGLVGGKDTLASVATRPRVFLTLTAPSFGKVHTGQTTDGRLRRCHPHAGCGVRHLAGDPLVGTAVVVEQYDYAGQVLFNAHAGALWAAFTTLTRRTLAVTAGVTRAHAARRVRVVFAKVAEFQTRGVVHVHAVIRLDAAEASDLPAWATTSALRRSVRRAARTARVITPASSGVPARRLRWGRQFDVRPITSRPGRSSVAVVAGYIAKYATKAAEAAGLAVGPIWCRACDATGATILAPGQVRVCRECHGTGRRTDVDLDRLTAHARALVETCWRLGARPEFAPLRLRRNAHQAGCRGQFLTKSRTWSTTFAALRAERHAYVQGHGEDGGPPATVFSGRSDDDRRS